MIYKRGSSTYTAHLLQPSQHDDDRGVVFPEHAPEVFRRLRQGALRCDVRLPVAVTLGEGETARSNSGK